MKLAFFISTTGDTDLALATIKALEKKDSSIQITLLTLTETAQKRLATFKSALSITQVNLYEQLAHDQKTAYSPEQLQRIVNILKDTGSEYAYIGVPSISSPCPFQIALATNNIPVLLAYEFMFKPESHDLWPNLPEMKANPNIRFALPLATALADFDLPKDTTKATVIGHLSIDKAFSPTETKAKSKLELQQQLAINSAHPVVFVSSTTQPTKVDTDFITCLLNALKNYPNMQIRWGLHPGITDLDAYLGELLKTIRQAPHAYSQFKIIATPAIERCLKKPEESIHHVDYQQLFIKVDVNGNEAASVADGVAQAVPGAIPNEAVLQRKPAYTHQGKPYLSGFAKNISAFFSLELPPAQSKATLGLDEKSSGEKLAEDIIQQLTMKNSSK